MASTKKAPAKTASKKAAAKVESAPASEAPIAEVKIPAKKSSSKKQTVSEFLEELGAEMKINSTISKKLLGAVVTKKFKPSSFGFSTHGMKVNSDRVPVWIKAKRDEKEYLILFYQPKPEGKKQKPAKTYYKLITEAAEA